ncbi:MAG: ribonuclease III [Roseiflexaceae bacterium]|nr:ribonuclease III [Roseiflexaceae bacterium]
MQPLEKLIARLGFIFSDSKLVQGALTHKSYGNEHPDRVYGLPDRERLEFLGDSVINYLAADFLFQRFPTTSEGQLTKLRSSLIKTSTLASFARELELGSYTLVGKGERASGANQRESMLADTFETLLAAIYIDRGLEAAHEFLLPFFEEKATLFADGADPTDDDHKSQLLAFVQRTYDITPAYKITSSDGPEHRPEFTAEVYKRQELLGSGHGPSKQAAEQMAAKMALAALLPGQQE